MSNGDVETLVLTHQRFVGHLVRTQLDQVPAHVNRDDLVSAGMLGLVVAAQKFDESRKVPFVNFAAIYIKGALTDELRGMDWAARSVRGRARDIDTATNTLAGTLRRAPTRLEVADAMGVDVEQLAIVAADVQCAAVLSLNLLTSVGDSWDLPLPDPHDGPEEVLLRSERMSYLRDALAGLPARHRLVVQGYIEDRKAVDIAAELGVSASRVSRMWAEALWQLRVAIDVCDGIVTPPEAKRRVPIAERRYCANEARFRQRKKASST